MLDISTAATRSRLCNGTSRRDFLRATSAGFGWLAFAALQAAENKGYVSPLAPKPTHHPARAKRVIFMFMNGGPSHLETFDWKPELRRVGGAGNHRLLGPVLDFKPRGQSGLFISDAFPHLADCADDLCLLNGMKTNNPGHQQAVVALHTGSENFVRPSMGRGSSMASAAKARTCPASSPSIRCATWAAR